MPVDTFRLREPAISKMWLLGSLLALSRVPDRAHVDLERGPDVSNKSAGIELCVIRKVLYGPRNSLLPKVSLCSNGLVVYSLCGHFILFLPKTRMSALFCSATYFVRL